MTATLKEMFEALTAKLEEMRQEQSLTNTKMDQMNTKLDNIGSTSSGGK